MSVKIERILADDFKVSFPVDYREARYGIAARAWLDFLVELSRQVPFNKVSFEWYRSIRTGHVRIQIMLNASKCRETEAAKRRPGAPAPYAGSMRKLIDEAAEKCLWSVTSAEDLLAALMGQMRFSSVTCFDMTYAWDKRTGLDWRDRTYPAFVDGRDLAEALKHMFSLHDNSFLDA